MQLVKFVWFVHLVSLLHLLLHLFRCLLIQYMGTHNSSRKQRVNPHPSRHPWGRWKVGATGLDRVARLVTRIWGLNWMARRVGGLAWDSCRGDGIRATRDRAWRETRIHCRGICRIGASRVGRVGGIGCPRVGTRLAWIGIPHGPQREKNLSPSPLEFPLTSASLPPRRSAAATS